MASRSKPSVLKRQRERKKAEKAALKREVRSRKEPSSEEPGSTVATREDLEGYGVVLSREDDLPPER
jgi:hypothetical protein